MKKVILLVGVIFLLTGCYDRHELTDLAIVSAISISKNNNKYTMTLQVINPRSNQDTSSSNQPKYIIYKNSSYSIYEALGNIKKEVSKRLYFEQMQTLIIDSSVAKDNIGDVLEFFINSNDFRNEFYVFISNKDDFLELLTSKLNLVNQNIWEDLENNQDYLGSVKLISFNELVSIYLNKNIELSLPVINTSSILSKMNNKSNWDLSNSNSIIEINNIAVFKNNKLIGYLKQDDINCLNFIFNNIKNIVIRNNYKDNGYIISKINDGNVKIKAKVDLKKINIDVNGNVSIVELNCNDCLNNFEKDLNDNIRALITDNIKSINTKYNSDIFGFKDLLYKTNPMKFKRVRNEIDNNLNNLKIVVNSKVVLDKNNIWGGIKNAK